MTPMIAKMLGIPLADLPPVIKRHTEIKRRLNMKSPVDNADFTVFDTELSGLDFKRDCVISIGAIKMKGGRIYPGKGYYSLVRPVSELNCKSVVVHGITHTDLCTARDEGSVIGEFLEFAGDSALVGHFSGMDIRFLNKSLRRMYNVSIESPVIDTASIHKWLMTNEGSYAKLFKSNGETMDLFYLAKKLGVKIDQAHNAFYDAYVTAQILQRQMHYLKDAGLKTIGEMAKIGRP